MGERFSRRILLIGWDGADWQMINPLIERGEMPCLAKMMATGVSGNLATIQPMISPILWTSIATGKRADKHGVCGFVEPASGSSGIQPVSSRSRKCKALWNILSQENLRSNVINWYATHPAEPVKGRVISNLFCELAGNVCKADAGLSAALLHPSDLAEELLPLIVQPGEISANDLLPLIPRLKEIDLNRDKRPKKAAQLLARTATVQAISTHLLNKGQDWDFSAIYFNTLDHFGHYFMSYHPPRREEVSESDFDLYQHVMAGCYRFMDLALAALLRCAGEETTVILVSDHGYRSGKFRPPASVAKEAPEFWHRPVGIACLKGPGIKQGEKLYGATILDVTPTVLTLLGLPVGQDMDGRPWIEILDKPLSPAAIFSWELRPGDSGLSRDSAEEADAHLANEALKQLEDLGYIQPSQGNRQERIKKVIRENKVNLAKALMNSRRIEKAIPLLKELYAEDPENNWYALSLAESYLRLKQFGEARTFWDVLPDRWKAGPQAHIFLAELAFEEERAEEALACIEKAEKLAPDWPRLHLLAGKAHFFLKNFEAAARSFERVLQVDEDNAFAHHGLARVYLERGEPVKAVESALEAVGLLHYFPDAHFLLGRALVDMGKEGEAIRAFEVCAGMTGSVNQAHVWLAKLYHSGSRDPEKARHYTKLLREAKNKAPFFFMED